MKRTGERIRLGVFGLALAGALGFGASQALATPAPRQAPPSCDEICNRVCQAAGFIGGFCGSGPSCSCYL